MKKTKTKYVPDFLQIPKLVMHLPPADRFVFGVVYYIAQLSLGKCIASNEEIGRIACVTPESVTNSLTRLEDEKLILRHYKDENRRTRSEIEVLIELRKIPRSNGIDTTKRLDEIPLDNGHIDNTLINKTTNVVETTSEGVSQPPVKEFNQKEEIKKLLSYKQQWLRIIGAYLRFKGLEFTNASQFRQAIKRNSKVARQLEDFDESQIERAFDYCDKWRDKKTGVKLNWKLESVHEQLLNNPNL